MSNVEVDYSSPQDDVVCTALHMKMPLQIALKRAHQPLA